MVNISDTSVRWSIGGMILTGKTEVLEEKSVPLPLCTPQIQHELG